MAKNFDYVKNKWMWKILSLVLVVFELMGLNIL
jgi:hypothetical protein